MLPRLVPGSSRFAPDWKALRARLLSLDGVVIAVACVLLVARFVGLEVSPPGFYWDEYFGALHIACISQTGKDGFGEAWPLFSSSGGVAGGYYTPPYLYFGALWFRVFGASIWAFRAIAAFFNVVTVAGVYVLARRLATPRFAFWAFVLAALSPCSFHFSRIAWDPPVAIAFLVWACAAWYAPRRTVVTSVVSGVLFALALYAYPSTRVQGPLLFMVIFGLALRERTLRLPHFLAFSATGLLLLVPLLRRMASDPLFTQRGARLAIFSSDYINHNHGLWPVPFFLLRTVLDSTAEHFKPGYLFLTGDPQWTHSTQFLGELGYLDALALGLGVLLLIVAVRGALRDDPAGLGEATRPLLSRYLVLCVAGILLGILPTALTTAHDSPHALRSLGAWPFFSLLGGALLATAERQWRAVDWVACGTTVVQAAFMIFVYVHLYPPMAADPFFMPLYRALSTFHIQSKDTKAHFAKSDPEAFRYYLIRSKEYDCESSARQIEAWKAGR